MFLSHTSSSCANIWFIGRDEKTFDGARIPKAKSKMRVCNGLPLTLVQHGRVDAIIDFSLTQRLCFPKPSIVRMMIIIMQKSV